MSHIRWMMPMVLHIKWGLTLGLTLVWVKTVLSLVMIGVQKYMIDDLFVEQKFEWLWPILWVFLASLLLYNACHTLGSLTLNIHARKANRWLLNKYAQAMHGISAKDYHNERIGRFTNYYTQEITNIALMFTVSNVVSDGSQKILSFIILVAVVGYASPVLLIGLLVIGFIIVPLGKYFAPRIRVLAREAQSKKSDINVHLVEGISSTREVIAFNRLRWESDILNRLFNRFYRTAMDEVKLANRQVYFSRGLSAASSFLVLAYGGYEVLRGTMSLGLFVVVYQFSNQLIGSVNGIYEAAMKIPPLFANIDRLRGVMEGEKVWPGQIRLSEPVQRMEFDNVSFRYREDGPYVLDGITLRLPARRKIAFVGASGGGKSTIAQLLIRFYEPVSGEIRMNGANLSDIERKAWTDRAAIVFQEPYLLPESIRTNLLLDRNHTEDEAMFSACRHACIHDDIMKLPDGYDTVLGERGITLSGGQRQRLALARALIRNPELLILDEATSALDLETERQVMNNLDDIRQGCTTIIIAHRLSTIQNADLIVVLDKGKVAATGTHEELMNLRNAYSELVLGQELNTA